MTRSDALNVVCQCSAQMKLRFKLHDFREPYARLLPSQIETHSATYV